MGRTFVPVGVGHFEKIFGIDPVTDYILDSSRSSKEGEESPQVVDHVKDRFAELHIG